MNNGYLIESVLAKWQKALVICCIIQSTLPSCCQSLQGDKHMRKPNKTQKQTLVNNPGSAHATLYQNIAFATTRHPLLKQNQACNIHLMRFMKENSEGWEWMEWKQSKYLNTQRADNTNMDSKHSILHPCQPSWFFKALQERKTVPYEAVKEWKAQKTASKWIPEEISLPVKLEEAVVYSGFSTA